MGSFLQIPQVFTKRKAETLFFFFKEKLRGKHMCGIVTCIIINHDCRIIANGHTYRVGLVSDKSITYVCVCCMHIICIHIQRICKGIPLEGLPLFQPSWRWMSMRYFCQPMSTSMIGRKLFNPALAWVGFCFAPLRMVEQKHRPFPTEQGAIQLAS